MTGPAGPPGPQGPQGAAGPDRLYQPSPATLVRNVLNAATQVTPRVIFDPRATYRYLATVSSSLVKLQGGLVMRAIVTAPERPNASSDQHNVRLMM